MNLANDGGVPSADDLIRCGPDSRRVDELAASPNINARRDGGSPRFLILHYTGLESFQRSVDVLRDPICQVSCHYVVDTDGRLVQMVREADRAWHAGQSFWAGERDINSWSVGIEIQNPGHELGYPEFPEAQMRVVIELAGDIVRRNNMRPEHVLAHSDIAPQRKIDPGEKFDWSRLHGSGVGHWVQPHAVGAEDVGLVDRIDPAKVDDRVRLCQNLLTDYGYEVARHGLLDAETVRVISAFQRHFRPAQVDGAPDESTIETLKDLIVALPTNDDASAT